MGEQRLVFIGAALRNPAILLNLVLVGLLGFMAVIDRAIHIYMSLIFCFEAT